MVHEAYNTFMAILGIPYERRQLAQACGLDPSKLSFIKTVCIALIVYGLVSNGGSCLVAEDCPRHVPPRGHVNTQGANQACHFLPMA